MKKLEFPVRPVRAPADAPLDWLGNRTKNHDPDADPCHCCECYVNEYPFLRVGEPIQLNRAYPPSSVAMQEVAGLYDRRSYRLQVRCSVCSETIELEGEIGATFDQKESVVTHISCLSSDVRAALEQIGYRMPFLIAKKVDHDVEQSGGDKEDEG